MITTIEESPYGDTGAVYEGALGIMQHFHLQLISFRPQEKTEEERAYLEADIAGYEEIIKSGKEENAQLFMQHKRDPETHLPRFKNNLAVIAYLKEQGLWVC